MMGIFGNDDVMCHYCEVIIGKDQIKELGWKEVIIWYGSAKGISAPARTYVCANDYSKHKKEK